MILFYSLINLFLERRIYKIEKIVYLKLNQDLIEQKQIYNNSLKKSNLDNIFLRKADIKKYIKEIEIRLNVKVQYLLLLRYFKKDKRRKYMINLNYYQFLKAILYLYNAEIDRDLFLAPHKVYNSINETKKCFNELIKTYDLQF